MAQQSRGFAGSWRLTLFPDAGTEPNLAFASLIEGGILMTSPPPVGRFPLTEDGIVFVSSGHGMWEKTGGATAALTFSAQARDGRGSLVGVGTVSAGLELSADGHEISGRYAFEIAGPDEVTFATEEGTLQFKRIVVKALAARITDGRAAA